jgi:hypothetical protein
MNLLVLMFMISTSFWEVKNVLNKIKTKQKDNLVKFN